MYFFPFPRSGLDIWSCHHTEYINKFKISNFYIVQKGSLGGQFRFKMETFAGVVPFWLREAEQRLVGLAAAPVRAIR